MIKNKKICYFLKSGRETRILKNHPDEFLYGLNFLKKQKFNVTVITDHELGFDNFKHPKLFSLLNMIFYYLIGIPGKSLISLFLERKIFLPFEMIFVTNNSYGLSLAFLKKIGLLDAKIFYVSMGLINDDTPFLWIIIYRWVLKKCKILTLSYEDSSYLEKKLKYKISYINFGVDKDFWVPSKSKIKYNYVLSIGNDLNRDYKTLIKSWKTEFPLLKIVTNQKIITYKKNIEIIFGDWATEVLSDKEIRDLIRKSLFVVLPIIDTIQPSGQSVMLQSMSCGKTVLITDFKGLWNRELIQNNKNMILTGKPGQDEKIAEIVSGLVLNKEKLKKIGLNARLVVQKKLNSNKMANEILEYLQSFLKVNS